MFSSVLQSFKFYYIIDIDLKMIHFLYHEDVRKPQYIVSNYILFKSTILKEFRFRFLSFSHDSCAQEVFPIHLERNKRTILILLIRNKCLLEHNFLIFWWLVCECFEKEKECKLFKVIYLVRWLTFSYILWIRVLISTTYFVQINYR